MLYPWTVPAFACSALDLCASLGYHLIHRSTHGNTWPRTLNAISSGSSVSLPVFRLWNLGTALHMFSAWFYPLGHHSKYTSYKTLQTAWNAGCQRNHWKDQAGLCCLIFMTPGGYLNEYSFFFLFSMIIYFLADGIHLFQYDFYFSRAYSFLLDQSVRRKKLTFKT